MTLKIFNKSVGFLMEMIKGNVDALIYVHPENQFTVARLKEQGKKNTTIIVGYLPSIQPGEALICKGTWKIHPSHGRQFEVSDCSVEMPSDVVGIQKYLESGLVKGIGPAFAKKIIDCFGAQTLKIIEDTPAMLLQIPGLGEKKLEKIITCWQQQRSIREVMIFLRSHDVSPAYAQKIFKIYGEKSIEKVQENPYQLAKDIFGIGFKTADLLAQKLGLPLHSPQRIAAGIEFLLWDLTGEGHTCFPTEDLVPLAASMLELNPDKVREELNKLVNQGALLEQPLNEKNHLWLKPFFAYEQGISKDVKRLLSSPTLLRSIDIVRACEWAQSHLKIQFAPEQKNAVQSAMEEKIHIITGGPGTGKSTITNAILAISKQLTDKILLAAPTGRAAKRLSEITHQKASTLHVLLEWDPSSNRFKKGRENQLNCDLLIVDEASMIDTPLLFGLLKAIPDKTRVIFIGDIDQLPSVGPGTVLRDLICSSVIPVTRLTEIFRQAKGSKIITNAHRINRGDLPDLYCPSYSDFHFIEVETPEGIQETILELVKETIPQKWHLDPIEDIQVLSPMKRGVIGIEVLNERLQELLNGTSQPFFRGGKRFHLGDKVMQLRNNYNKKVSNGDIGRIYSIDIEEQEMVISFDDKMVSYDFSELDELVLSYAASVHKYQGSECPCIILPIHTTHFKLLHRNLLYTGVTRGKKQVYLVGTKKAVAIAVKNDQVLKRHTGLEKALSSIVVQTS